MTQQGYCTAITCSSISLFSINLVLSFNSHWLVARHWLIQKQYPQGFWLLSHRTPFDPSLLAEQHLPLLCLQLCMWLKYPFDLPEQSFWAVRMCGVMQESMHHAAMHACPILRLSSMVIITTIIFQLKLQSTGDKTGITLVLNLRLSQELFLAAKSSNRMSQSMYA